MSFTRPNRGGGRRWSISYWINFVLDFVVVGDTASMFPVHFIVVSRDTAAVTISIEVSDN